MGESESLNLLIFLELLREIADRNDSPARIKVSPENLPVPFVTLSKILWHCFDEFWLADIWIEGKTI